MHDILLKFSHVLLTENPPPPAVPLPSSSFCESHTYENEHGCIKFLSNWGTNKACDFQVDSVVYTVPAWSVTILADGDSCVKPEYVYNTKTSSVPGNTRKAVPLDIEMLKGEVVTAQESIPPVGVSTITSDSPLEQLSTTHDTTDYLFYSTSVQSPDKQMGDLTFTLGLAAGSHVRIFLNQIEIPENSMKIIANNDSIIQLSVPLTLASGVNHLTIMCVAMGIQNSVHS